MNKAFIEAAVKLTADHIAMGLDAGMRISQSLSAFGFVDGQRQFGTGIWSANAGLGLRF